MWRGKVPKNLLGNCLQNKTLSPLKVGYLRKEEKIMIIYSHMLF